MADINITRWHEFPGNFSNGTAVDGIGTMFQYANTVVGGWFGMLILFMTAIISFIAVKSGTSSEKAFGASAFSTAFIATLLMRIDLIAVHWVIVLWAVAAIGILIVRNETNQGL